MTNSKYYGYLEDIIDAIDKAQYFITGMKLYQFKNDEKTQFACIRALEIICIFSDVRNILLTLIRYYNA